MKKLITATALMSASFATLAGGLTAGDIAIIGINTDDADAFTFVATVDLPEGEQITFTDSGILSGAFRGNEGAVQYTVPMGGIAAGIVVEFTGVGGDWAVANDANVGNNGFVLSTSGDQVIAFSGSSAAPTFIFAAQTNSTQFQATADANDSNRSELPPGLIEGTTAVAVGAGSGTESEFDNSEYTGPRDQSDKASALAAIANATNWTGDNTRIDPLNTTAFGSLPVELQSFEIE